MKEPPSIEQKPVVPPLLPPAVPPPLPPAVPPPLPPAVPPLLPPAVPPLLPPAVPPLLPPAVPPLLPPPVPAPLPPAVPPAVPPPIEPADPPPIDPAEPATPPDLDPASPPAGVGGAQVTKTHESNPRRSATRGMRSSGDKSQTSYHRRTPPQNRANWSATDRTHSGIRPISDVKKGPFRVPKCYIHSRAFAPLWNVHGIDFAARHHPCSLERPR